MKKLKFLKSKLILTFSVIAVISFAVFVYTAIAANAQVEANRAAEAKSKNETPKKVESEDKSVKSDDNPSADNSNIADGVDGVQDVTNNGSGVAPVSKPRGAVQPQPVAPAPAPTPAPAPKPADTPKKDGGHIPFTNKPVTPGNPDSYAGTVGQCPFHEMVGEKGCQPPANLECNADWTVCREKK